MEYAAREFWATIGPGGRWHPAAFIEHKGHLVLEALLVVVISTLLLQHSYKPASRKGEALTEKVRARLAVQGVRVPMCMAHQGVGVGAVAPKEGAHVRRGLKCLRF